MQQLRGGAPGSRDGVSWSGDVEGDLIAEGLEFAGVIPLPAVGTGAAVVEGGITIAEVHNSGADSSRGRCPRGRCARALAMGLDGAVTAPDARSPRRSPHPPRI